MSQPYEIDHLSDFYSGMSEGYGYITNIIFPYTARVANKSVKQARALNGRTIFKIATWPEVKPKIEKRCKSDSIENY